MQFQCKQIGPIFFSSLALKIKSQGFTPKKKYSEVHISMPQRHRSGMNARALILYISVQCDKTFHFSPYEHDLGL